MAVQHANRGIVKKDLQLYYNREWPKSFPGEATTNLIATYSGGAANSYPSVGNYWATFNTNQYNNNTYFSIGTISSVTNNIVTTATNHPLRTYDVVRPQTSGGGVTAGTDYYVVKRSNTTFTLHAYNSTQDGSASMATILSPILSDTRISVNSTSFPTMWWGAPHLPNSGIIKEIIPNGFSFAGRLHDCLRLNWHRPDGVVDGMAYGVTPSYTGNTSYTFSAYVRAASQSALGGTIRMETYHAGPNVGGPSNSSPTLSYTWKKWTWTWTSNATSGAYLFYYWPNMACPAQVDISEMQFEQKSYATGITFSSRSANTVAGGGGLLDLSGNNINADLTNVSFDANGYIFTGASSNRVQFTTPTSFIYSAAGKTVLMWVKYSSTGYVGFCGLGNAANGQSFNLRSPAATVQYLGFMGYNADYDPSAGPQINNNVWHLIGATFDAYGAGNLKLYVDGVNIASTTNTLNTVPEASNIGYIGRSSHTGAEGYLTGQVGQFMLYNRALSADEVLQIFNSQRTTYGV